LIKSPDVIRTVFSCTLDVFGTLATEPFRLLGLVSNGLPEAVGAQAQESVTGNVPQASTAQPSSIANVPSASNAQASTIVSLPNDRLITG
jgi:hypothetical protein